MCQTGGPRCSNHAQKTLERNREELDKLKEEGKPTRGKEREVRQSLLTYYSTPRGQEELKSRLERVEGAEKKKVESMLSKAKKLRTQQVKEGKDYRRSLLLDSEYQQELPQDVLEEQKQALDAIKKRTEPLSKFAQHALDADLSPKPLPDWNRSRDDFTRELYGTGSELIDTFDYDGREVSVIWEERSHRDASVQYNEGYKISRITYYDSETQEEIGYIQTVNTDEESYTQSFGNDEFSSYRALEARSSLHLPWDKAEEREVAGTRFKDRRVEFPVSTEEERLETERALWKSSYTFLRMTPPSALGKGYWDIKPPQDEAEMRKELAFAKKRLDAEAGKHLNDSKRSVIDFSKLEEEHKGKGLGTSLYVYMGRKLGEKGKTLSSSGVQSDEAQTLWKSITKKKDLPVKVSTTKFERGNYKAYSNRFMLDFRKQDKKKS